LFNDRSYTVLKHDYLQELKKIMKIKRYPKTVKMNLRKEKRHPRGQYHSKKCSRRALMVRENQLQQIQMRNELLRIYGNHIVTEYARWTAMVSDLNGNARGDYG
jgi:hypothetical protein